MSTTICMGKMKIKASAGLWAIIKASSYSRFIFSSNSCCSICSLLTRDGFLVLLVGSCREPGAGMLLEARAG